MNSYILKLLSNGDIEIIEINFLGDTKLIYHKSYNLGDNLKINLHIACEKLKKIVEANF